ncbi:PREDICTED: UDP-glycosyltransferase 76F1-like isoform X1 [Camelina sativa]|uniref:UDP-glycosyltransferase 76F1-like isoform X1 n=1 Tax=Camelina sativa TaxID=90675 RepID=A0ABM0YQJ1_CAMSA|nr:PREDICTED: UDP-glycosyltransferase 76F1-like isoform X1 [Camelina sativa]
MEERKGRRIIMFPLPFTGHFNPMIELAGIFHHRGFSITIIHTSFNLPDLSRYPHFTFRTITYKNEEEEDPISRSETSSDTTLLIGLLKQCYAEPFRQSLAAEVCGGGETVCCLVSDALWGRSTEVVAQELGVRRLVLRTGAAVSFCVYTAFPLLIDKGYLHIQDSRLDEPVTELPPLKVKDLPVTVTKEPEDLYRILNDMLEGAKSSSGVIWNTFEDLERVSLFDFNSKLQVPFFPVGPFHKHSDDLPPKTKNKDDDEITDWLNKQEPQSVVYVSFGSLAAIDEKEFLEIALGLKNSKRPFLWVVRQCMVRGTEWLESLPYGFLDNIGQTGKIVKWVNQLEVLVHPAVGAFWTHCGWNSTLESICEGVPMICTPCFSDQHLNARYIADVWRVGMVLERSKMERKEIEKVITSVMMEKGDGLRERCLKLKERANFCLSKNGSSSKYLDKLVSHVLSFDS